MATQKKRRSKYFNENRERLRLLKLSTNEISNLWYDAQTKAINLGLQTSYVNNNTTQLYTFSDYPELNKQMVKVVNTLTTDAVNAINAITEDAWQTATPSPSTAAPSPPTAPRCSVQCFGLPKPASPYSQLSTS